MIQYNLALHYKVDNNKDANFIIYRCQLRPMVLIRHDLYDYLKLIANGKL